MISITRIADRTDRRLADCLSAEERPLLLHRDSMMFGLLRFKDSEIERMYRQHFSIQTGRSGADAAFDDAADNLPGRPATKGLAHKLVAPKYSVILEIVVAVVFYAIVCVVLWANFALNPSPAWITVFVLTSLGILAFSTYLTVVMQRYSRLPVVVTGWYDRHLLAILFIELSAVAALSNITFKPSAYSAQPVVLYVIFTTILAHCNFSQVTHWLKTVFAVILGIVIIAVVNARNYPCIPNASPGPNHTILDKCPEGMPDNCFLSLPEICWFRYEVILDAFMAIVLVGFLNHQFESIFRMSFFGNVQSVRDIELMESMKEQADMLLFNIIPPFVVDKLKSELKYSKNHDTVAVLFASIVNWNEMYEESYEKGREFLRVLNEIIGDFDDLLMHPEFDDLEKIKTIGSTYMAASGLNPESKTSAGNQVEHVLKLMEFALALQQKLDSFNQDMLSFAFKMKIGFNVGPVTAGVIGTTKLYFDIWGDTVNIASRMYSTGVIGRIQVSEHVREMLDHVFEFEFRDHIEVKGIDAGMDVYLVSGRKDGQPLWRDWD